MISDFKLPDNALAALYFIEGGHYLLKHRVNKTRFISKFVNAKDLKIAFSQNSADSDWISSGIQRFGFNRHGPWYVYFRPQCKITLRIEIGAETKAVRVPIPSTVMIGRGKSYYIWAMAKSKFGTHEMLYRAPFPNVNEDGSICWGANSVTKADVNRAEANWANFFSSPFNGHLVKDKSRTHDEDVRELLFNLDGVKRFPRSELIPYAHSTKKVFANLIGG